MISKYLKLLVFIAMIHAVPMFGADRGVEVRPHDTELIQTEPNKTVTTVFRVTNTSTGDHEFVPEAGLPEGWKLVTQDFPFRLSENGMEIKIVSFYIPQNTTAGLYEIDYRVKDRQFPSIEDQFRLSVRVIPYRKITVRPIEPPRSAVAGESYVVRMLVHNESNVSDSAVVEVKSNMGYPVSAAPTVFALNKGEMKDIAVSVQTDPKLSYISKDHLQVTVRLLRDKQVVASDLVSVDLFPRITGTSDSFHRIPATVTLSQVFGNDGRTVNGGNGYGFQGEIEGGGTLAEGSDKTLQFRLRGPDIYQTSIYGQHDEYVFSLSSKHGAIHIGDRPYSLSTLTDQSRYGRGIEGQWQFGHTQIGGFYHRTRWYTPSIGELSGYVKYKPAAAATIGLNALRQNQGGREDGLVSMTGSYSAGRNFQAEAEAAAGGDGKKTPGGYYLKLAGQTSRFYGFMDLIYTDPGFPGYFKDTRFLSGGFSVDLMENFRLNAAYRYEKQKYTIDTTLYSAPLGRFAQVGLNYRLPGGTSVLAELVRQSREDRYLFSRFNYAETLFRIKLSKAFSILSFDGSIEAGRTEDRILDRTAGTQRYSGSMFLHPSGLYSCRVYAYYDDNRRYGGDRSNRLTLGFDAEANPFRDTQVKVHYQNNHSPENYYLDRDLFEIQLSKNWNQRHLIGLRARQTIVRNSFSRKEAAFLLDYRLNLGIPVSRKKNTGMLFGRLIDQETLLPVSDVVIRINGSSAVTDGDGRYVFPSLKPGTYYLRLDKVKIGLDRITVKPTPMEVVVLAGGRQTIDLAVTRSASFSGKVVLCRSTADSVKGDQGAILNENGQYAIVGSGRESGSGADCVGIPNILIEMTHEGETVRRVTDAEGRFSFEELRPGVWSVKAYDYNLPEYHAFDKDVFTVELKPAEARSRTINVLPKKRRIQFIQEGGTITESSR
jgi:hypothetical protein